MTKTELKMLEIVTARVKALADKNNKKCGVEPEHKEAVRLYLETWVIPQLEVVVKPSNERDALDNRFLLDETR